MVQDKLPESESSTLHLLCFKLRSRQQDLFLRKASAPPDSAGSGLWPIRWPVSENQLVNTVDKAIAESGAESARKRLIAGP